MRTGLGLALRSLRHMSNRVLMRLLDYGDRKMVSLHLTGYSAYFILRMFPFNPEIGRC
jgi:hypothetical protein